MCQQERSTKCKEAKKCLGIIRALMASNENVNSVTAELARFIKFYQDANEIHESFVSLPLPQDEVARQNKNHEEKMTMFYEFTERVKGWLSEMGQPYEQPTENVNDQHVADEIHPEDSASNLSSVKVNYVRTQSQLSRISFTPSARVEAKADRAALMERVAALGRKHLIEDQEERLRKEKEQLELETELAVTNAKLHVLKINSSQGGSKRSDGMYSYFKRNTSQKAIQLSPRANTFVPANVDGQRHVFSVSDPITQSQVVRPATQTVYENQAGRVQTQTLTDNYQNDIVNVMQRQNDIAALLVQHNLCSVLPVRNTPVFDGDPLQYKSFIRAFENGVEEKTTNWSDCFSTFSNNTPGGSQETWCAVVNIYLEYKDIKEPKVF